MQSIPVRLFLPSEVRWRVDVQEQLNAKHRGTMPVTRKIMTPMRKFPANYERNNYNLSRRQKSTVSVSNFLHIISCPAEQRHTFLATTNTLGIREVNSTKTRPCALRLVLQWLICKGSGILTHSWLGEIAVTSLCFREEARPGTYSRGCCGRHFWPQRPVAGLPPFGHLLKHTHIYAAPAGWIGLPLRSNGCLCLASSTNFDLWSRAMP